MIIVDNYVQQGDRKWFQFNAALTEVVNLALLNVFIICSCSKMSNTYFGM